MFFIKPATYSYVPVPTRESRFAVDAEGVVTVEAPAKLLRRARRVPLDKAGSFLWMQMDGQNTVEDLIRAFHREFPKVKDPQPKVLQFLSSLRRDGLVDYKKP